MVGGTSVENVANAVTIAVTWQYTGEVIQERNHTSVQCVTRVSVSPATCSHIKDLYTATVDRMIVITVVSRGGDFDRDSASSLSGQKLP